MRSSLTALISGVVLGALLVAGAYFGYRWWLATPPGAGTAAVGAASAAPADNDVRALGRIEPAGGVVAVGAPAGFRLGSLSVSAGDQLKEGQEIGRLESYDAQQQEILYVEVQLEEAESRLAAEEAYGQALLAEAAAAAEQVELQESEVATAEERLKILATQARVARQQYERLAPLDERLVSRQERERQALAAAQAEAELAAAERSLAQLKALHEANRRTAALKQRTAEANLQRLRASDPRRSLQQQLVLAQAKLESMVVRAPLDGRVLKVRLRPGEMTGHRPVVEMGDLRTMFVVAEVYETDVSKLREEDRAEISGGGLKGTLGGKVAQIGSVVAGNVERDLDPTANVDRRVVEVRIVLDDKDGPRAARFVGMQVDVKIESQGKRAEAEESE